jgi:hypothetical protein
MTASELIRLLQTLPPDMVVVIPSDEPQRAQDFVAVSEVTIDTVAPERGHPTNLQLADERDTYFRRVVRLQ